VRFGSTLIAVQRGFFDWSAVTAKDARGTRLLQVPVVYFADRHSGRAAWRSAEGFSPRAVASELLTSRGCSELRATGPMHVIGEEKARRHPSTAELSLLLVLWRGTYHQPKE
jgi:hypothetical protein